MQELELTPEEIKWLQAEQGLENIPDCEILEISCKEKRVLEPTPLPKRIKPFHFPALLSEITVTASALSRGASVVAGDLVSVQLPKQIKNKAGIIRLRNNRTTHDIAKLNTEFSTFINTMITHRICEFKGKVIYAPPRINLLDEIIVSLEIYIIKEAFEFKEINVNDRKAAFDTLFEKIGLIQQTVKKLKDEIDLGQEIYSKASLIDSNMKPMDPAEGFLLTLREYQLKALSFMYTKEQANADMGISLSPLWIKVSTQDHQEFYYSPFSTQLSIEFPRERHCQGGILADEMGLGKTIEMIALMHTSRFLESSSLTSEKNEPVKKTGATLIICPLNLVPQWRDEIKKCIGSAKTLIFHGTERDLKLKDAFAVITTYGTLTSEYEHKEKSLLYSVKWHRIVLDEAHYIKERSTLAAKACYDLAAFNKWAITGTPIINKLDDLYSIVKFLKVEPWSSYSYWNAFITTPFQKRDVSALTTVQTILEPLIIRRTKDMKDTSGNLIIPLPKKNIEIKYLEFSPTEREMYEAINAYSKSKLEYLKLIGKADYLHVFALLTKLRQACNHPNLISKTSTDESELQLESIIQKYCSTKTEYTNNLESEIKNIKECPVCFESEMENILLPCLHTSCKPCIQDIITTSEEKGEDILCPICRQKFTESQVLKILETESNSITLKPLNYQSSTKLESLLELLKKTKDKVIVFSQWTSMLDLVQNELNSCSIEYTRLDGTMTLQKRDTNLNAFHKPGCKVLLASLRSTGVDNVVLLDPWWNVSIENQAIDRVHRIGQTKDVNVYKYIIRGSVEEKIIEIQRRKSELVGAVNGEKMSFEELIELF
ncbi:DNA helicase rad5 [Boothiomyces macroporosus]|uniref:DNA helicase rad5 n=1 Tax=Boothiomyces macroporosus TaxID=261099 RepID=A0AAD5YAE0_9FUNG|nr:DNA helicase rad5 [Boothiomyces macroporosus]